MAVARKLLLGAFIDDDDIISLDSNMDNDLVWDYHDLKGLFQADVSPQIKVMQMATGYMHMVVLTTDGRVFTRGTGGVGQMGLGEEMKGSYMFAEVDPVHFRSSVPHDRPIMVTCGLYFCATLTTAGEVYAWGENGFGCLGRGLPLKHRQYEPQRVNFENVATSKLCMISSYTHHTLALGSGGELYAWGANANGQLGLCPESRIVESEGFPKKLADQETNKQKFVFVSAGGDHSSAVTEEGRVYTWGAGFNGQLGLGIKTWPTVFFTGVTGLIEQEHVPTHVSGRVVQVYFPTRVTGLIEQEHVVMTSCGDEHTLLLTIDGRLWSTGRGREGQLSIGIDNQDIYSFHPIPDNGFDKKRVITATAGDGHSTAVREDGAVFTWGAGYSRLNNNIGIDTLKYLNKNAIGKMQPAATRYAMITRGDILALAMGTHQRLAGIDTEHVSPIYQLSEMTEILKMIWDAGRNEPLPSHVAPHHEGLVRLIGGGCFD